MIGYRNKLIKKIMKNNIGKTATIEYNGLEFEVKILDYKFTYAKHRYLITPVSGEGERWVENINL